MAINFSIEGFLIYGTMLAYLLAAAAMLLSQDTTGARLYVGGFLLATAAFAARWGSVGYAPLSNLYEVFLCLGMLLCPLSFFCRRFLRTGGLATDCLIGATVLFPAGFVLSAAARPLPPALQTPLFVPHVAAYMAAYIILAKAGVQAAAQLLGMTAKDCRLVDYETGAYRMVRLGFPLLTLGLILGACWGKLAWGDYWNWDPKELWSLASWLIFVGYLHFRHQFGRRRPRVNSSLVLAGLAAIILTLLWVNLAARFEGMHSYAN